MQPTLPSSTAPARPDGNRDGRGAWKVRHDGSDGETLDDGTRNQYLKRVGYLARALVKGGDPATAFERLTPDMAAAYMEGQMQSPRLSRASFRAYRAALIFWLRQRMQQAREQGRPVDGMLDALERIRALSPAGFRAQGGTQSGRNVRGVPAGLMERFQHYAQGRGRRLKYMEPLMAFLKANLLVGLRPGEWFGVTFNRQEMPVSSGGVASSGGREIGVGAPVMQVENAKTTHGRGNAPIRGIVLHGISADDMTALVYFHNMVEQYRARNMQQAMARGVDENTLHRAFFSPLQRTLVIMLRELGIGRESAEYISLYSTRHQAIADARHAGCSQHEIVAMFGHGSVRSAATPDGCTLQRRAGFTFTADAASMEQVRQSFATPRHAIRAQQHRQMYEQSRQVAEDLLGDQRRY